MNIDGLKIPREVRDIASVLMEAGHKSWIVGGCVRDLIRTAPVADWDLCTSALPEQILSLFPKVLPTGLQHGTVTVVQNEESFEVTTLRGDGSYTDGRRPDSVTFVSTIEEDLARRDFTINSIAVDLATLEVVDPFGGLDDLRNGVLRAVGDPNTRFSEDGLRVLRAARFSAILDLELDPGTLAAIPQNLSTFFAVSRERVRDEWKKTICRSKTPSKAFCIMRQSGLLDKELIARYSEDEFNKAMSHLDLAPRDLVTGMAAILLEIPATAKEIEAWLRSLKLPSQDIRTIAALVSNVKNTPTYVDFCEFTASDIRKWASSVTRQYLDSVRLLLNIKDPRYSSLQLTIELCLIDSFLSIEELAVSGEDLMSHCSLSPSPMVGKILRELLQQVLADPRSNQRTTLLSIASDLTKEIL